MRLKGATVNFLGDSITFGIGASCTENRYTDVLAREFGLAKVNNYGVSGSRFARQRVMTDDPSDLDFCMRMEEMTLDADAVVVFGGTNDFGHGQAPLGMPCDREPDTFYGALHTLFTMLLTRYTDSKILVLTPTHRLNENDPDCNGLPLKAYVDVIREMAEFYSLPVLDLYATSGIQPNVPAMQTRYMPDGLHPNDAGHAMLAEMIARKLEQM